LEHQVRQQPIGAPGGSAEDGKEWNARAVVLVSTGIATSSARTPLILRRRRPIARTA
jgi:hypothetical protein